MGGEVAINPQLRRKEVTIANGASLSTPAECHGLLLCAIEMPAAWTAAAITFIVAAPAVGNLSVYGSDGTEKSVTVGASQFVVLTPADFAGIEKIILRSGTSGTPVNQGAERTIGLWFRSAS